MSISAVKARAIALSFPGTEERVSQGGPAIFVGKKILVRIGTREPDTIQFNTDSIEERDHLIAADPDVFFITAHFQSFKGLLARRTKLDEKTYRGLLERRFRAIAPKG